MDVQTPLLQPTSLPRSHSALAAGAGIATVSLASVSLAASYWHNDGRLPYYAAEAVCGAGLCVSLLKLQTVRDTQLRISHAQSARVPHFSLLPDQQAINQLAASMTGVGAVLGAASVGLATAGRALKLPTQNNIAAAGVGFFNLLAALIHFSHQVHVTAPRMADDESSPLPQSAASPV